MNTEQEKEIKRNINILIDVGDYSDLAKDYTHDELTQIIQKAYSLEDRPHIEDIDRWLATECIQFCDPFWFEKGVLMESFYDEYQKTVGEHIKAIRHNIDEHNSVLVETGGFQIESVAKNGLHSVRIKKGLGIMVSASSTESRLNAVDEAIQELSAEVIKLEREYHACCLTKF